MVASAALQLVIWDSNPSRTISPPSDGLVRLTHVLANSGNTRDIPPFVKERMDITPNQLTKNYYFSAVHGFLKRVYNFEYDKELLLVERMLNFCHNEIHNVLQKGIAISQRFPQPKSIQTKLNDLLEPKDIEKKLIKKPIRKSSDELKRIDELKNPDDLEVTLINPNFFNYLSSYIEEMRIAVETDKPLLNSLRNIVELTYTLTGNGRYLLLKGKIKLDLD